MRLAVTYNNGAINTRFGQTKAFKLFDIEEGAIQGQSIREFKADTLDEKAMILKGTGADKLICGNICMHCQKLVREAGIEIIGCVYGDADAAVDAYLAGTLLYETDPEILK
ncbi:MAG: NifB/NifX family molybdenum-iron cluster-binding protein [Eubacterium sp.]|nr:NifB/NifX family molybdenum-iron cluster-binding protein [Eubacterium sp.]